jgi:hypothetical protein
VGRAAVTPYEVRAVDLDPQADNRIHDDDDVAQRFGFAGPLVPGVEVFVLASAPLVAAWGAGFLASGRMALRFRRPVYDGERVRVHADDASAAGADDGLTPPGTVFGCCPMRPASASTGWRSRSRPAPRRSR